MTVSVCMHVLMMSIIILLCTHAVRVIAEETLFTYSVNPGRKKRQIPGSEFECTSFENCGDHSFVGVEFSDLNITDEHRAFCNNDTTCIYDLIVTGDEEVAEITREASENNTMLQSLTGEWTVHTIRQCKCEHGQSLWPVATRISCGTPGIPIIGRQLIKAIIWSACLTSIQLATSLLVRLKNASGPGWSLV